MLIRKQDIPATPERTADRALRQRLKAAEALKPKGAMPKWADLTAKQKDDVLKALAIQFGFVAPD